MTMTTWIITRGHGGSRFLGRVLDGDRHEWEWWGSNETTYDA